MEIRNAHIRDLEEIIVLNKIDDYGNPDIYIKEAILDGRVLIALKDSEITGFILYEFIWGNTLLLALAKVHTNYQGNRIGTMLVQQFESHIKKKGFKSYCSSTMQENTLAQDFHAKLGFVEIGILELPHGKEMFYRKDIGL